MANKPRKNRKKLLDLKLTFHHNGSKMTLALLETSWAHVFRNKVYPHLPVDIIADKYSDNTDRPTINLATLLGMVIIQQMRDLSDSEIFHQVKSNALTRHALKIENVSAKELNISPETYFTFRQKLAECDLGETFFDILNKELDSFFDQPSPTPRSHPR